MAIWKVSYVVKGSDLPGGILNLDHAPQPGEVLQVGNFQFDVLEALELIPPKGDFHYIHVTCRLLPPKE
jgi:hypothetical protein